VQLVRRWSLLDVNMDKTEDRKKLLKAVELWKEEQR
jgi:hypothetical protein